MAGRAFVPGNPFLSHYEFIALAKAEKLPQAFEKKVPIVNSGLSDEMRKYLRAMGQVGSHNPVSQAPTKPGNYNQVEEPHLFLILYPSGQGTHMP